MNKHKRILSLFLAILMILSVFPTSLFAAEDEVKTKTEVVKSHKVGDKLVFDVLKAKNPRRYKAKAPGGSFFAPGAPATIDQKVTIDLSTVGLGENSSSFDWSLLPSGLKVTVYFTDQGGTESERQEVTLTQSNLSQDVKLKVPATGGTGKLHAEIPDIDNNLAIRVIRSGESTADTTVGSGDWSFTVDVSEITSPVINLVVKDPYGNPATAAGDVKAKLNVAGLGGEQGGLDIPFTISQGNTSFNLKQAELLNGEDYDITELNYPGTSPILTVESETSGKLTLGTGADAVEYKVEKTYSITDGGTITLTSQPKVITPQDPNNPGTVPDGYVRVTFNSGEGYFTDNSKTKETKVFDVKNTLTWKQATENGVTVPTAKYKNADKVVDNTKPWDPALPAEGTTVATETYTAQFKENRDVIEDPTTPTPADGYVRVTFNSGEGYFTDNSKTKETKVFDVKNTLTWKQATENGVTVPTAKYKNADKVVDNTKPWDPALPAEGTTVATETYTAQFKENRDVIEDPTTPTPADGYVRVTFNSGEGYFTDNSKTKETKVFDVKNTLTWKQATENGVTVPTAKYKNADKVVDNTKPWDPALPAEGTTVATETYTAQFKENRDVIEDPTTPTPADGYVRVTFNSGEGYFTDNSKTKETKVFDVKNTLTWKQATENGVTVPTAKYKNADKVVDNTKPWDPALPAEGTTVATETYTAQFKENRDVIEDPTTPTPADGYVRVTFNSGEGYFTDNSKTKETKVFDVKNTLTWKQATENGVTVPTAKYKNADKVVDNTKPWDPALPAEGTTVATETYTAQFKENRDVIEDPTTPTPADGYVRVTFNSGEGYFTDNSKTKETKVFDVKNTLTWKQATENGVTVPTAKYKNADKVVDNTKPWDPALPAEGTTVATETYTAQFKENRDVIEDPTTPTPADGYVRVTFNSGEGYFTDNSKTKETKVFDVKNTLTWKQATENGVTVPTAKYKNADKVVDNTKPWDPALPAEGTTVATETYTAQFKENRDVIEDPTTPTPADGYVRVTFNSGEGYFTDNSKTKETKVFDVKNTLTWKQATENGVTVPTAKYKNADKVVDNTKPWDPALPAEGTTVATETYTAQFKENRDVIEDPTTPTPADGYVRVTFNSGEGYFTDNSKTKETKVFDVKNTLTWKQATENGVTVPTAKYKNADKVVDNTKPWDPALPAEGTTVATETYTAQFKENKDVIEDPTTPTPADGYVRVTFNSGEGYFTDNSKTKETKVFDVKNTLTWKQATENGVTVPTAKYKNADKVVDNTKPWDPALPAEGTTVATETYTAQFKENKDVIEDPTTPTPADGYVRVTFNSGEGYFTDNSKTKETKVFDVKNTLTWKQATENGVTVPTAKYKNADKVVDNTKPWDPALPAEGTTVATETYTAQFKENRDVIEDPTTPTPADGYVRVTFNSGEGYFTDNSKTKETKVFDVKNTLTWKQATENGVTVPTAKYKNADKVVDNTKPWDPALPAEGTTVATETYTAQFKENKDVIEDPTTPTPADGYVRVTFNSGEGYFTDNSKTKETKVFDVKNTLTWKQATENGVTVPTAKYKNADKVVDNTKPWDPALPAEGTTVATETYTAQFKENRDVIEDPTTPTPADGYVRVTFNSGEGYFTDNSKTKETKVFDVKNTLTWKQATENGVTVPTAKYKNADKVVDNTKPWDPALPAEGTTVATETYTAQFKENKDVIEDPTTPTPADGYVRVTFNSGEGYFTDNSKTKETKVFDVKNTLTWKQATENGVTVPTAKYKNADKVVDNTKPWDPALPAEGTTVATETYTAQFKENRDVIEDPTTPTPADGYVRVTFNSGEGYFTDNSKTKETKVFDVKNTLTWKQATENGVTVPTAKYKNADKVVDNTKPWDPALPAEGTTVATETYTAQFKENRDVIEDPTTPTPADGYVRVTFNSGEGYFTDNSKTKETKVFDVKNTLTWKQATENGVTVPTAKYKNADKVVDNTKPWDPALPAEGTTVATETYTAQFKENKDVIEDPTTPTPADGYVRVTFNSGEGYFTDNSKTKETKVFDVKNTLTWKQATENGVTVPTAKYKNADKVVDNTKPWDPALPAEGTTVATETYTAKYKSKTTPGATDADKYTPEGKDITVNTGDTPNPADGISNKDKLPKGTTFDFDGSVDTSTPGVKRATIIVTYPDQSTDIVYIRVIVKDKTTPPSPYEPGDNGHIYDHDHNHRWVFPVVPNYSYENTLWYIFTIDSYKYQEVRNKVATDYTMDVTPVIRNNRTMLPLRYVAEALGADVEWDKSTRTARFTKGGLTASIQIDGNEIVLSNGQTVKMDSKPLNINSRILVPVVNVANVFGLTNGNTLDGIDQDIEWDAQARTATIYIKR